MLTSPYKIKNCGFKVKNISKKKLQKIIEELGKFIINNIEYEKSGRLFPADPFIYYTNSLNLGFGAIGILYSLKKCGFEIPKKAYYWIEEKFKEITPDNYPPGFLTGISGIAWGLYELGYREKSIELMELVERHPLKYKNHSLFYGMAGIGLTNLFMYLNTKNNKFLERALNLGDKIIELSKKNKKGVFLEHDNKIYLGYGYGQSGVALFLLRLFQISKEKRYLELGKKLINFDLKNGKKTEKNVISFPEAINDPTLEHYIECGTAGIIKGILRYKMFDKLEKLIPDIYRKYSVFPGLLFGICSFIDTFVDVYIFTKNSKYLKMLNRPLNGLIDLYIISTPEGYAVPGDNLFRISCDYATGGAGVMRTLYRVLTLDKADFILDEFLEK